MKRSSAEGVVPLAVEPTPRHPEGVVAISSRKTVE